MSNLITTSKVIAFLSFVIGTILFVLQLYFTSLVKLTTIGIVFVITAVVINSILLIGLIFRLLFGLIFSTINHNNKLNLLKSIGLVLLNIPIAIIYLFTLLKYL